MTTGIYKLIFNNTNAVYVGQSINVEQRFKQHINAFKRGNSSCKKAQQAYNQYGEPTLEILEECSRNDLNVIEDKYIKVYNSSEQGFNFNSSSTDSPILFGELNGYSKYKLEDYFCVLYYLGQEGYSISRISEILDISKKVIEHICYEGSHAYLKELYPDMYADMEKLNDLGRNNLLQRTGKSYPAILSPEGVVYSKITNVSKFAKEHELLQPKLHEVLNGSRKTHKGWKLA